MQPQTQQQREERSVVIPLTDLNRQDVQLRRIFNRYDTDRDGKLSIFELKNVIESREYENDIPDEIVSRIMETSDVDRSGFLDFNEFKAMVKKPEYSNIFGHLFFKYVHTIIPSREQPPTDAIAPAVQYSVADGVYEEQYSLYPPPVCMLLISLIEIVLFAVDAAVSHVEATGPVATALIYNPYKRYEAWRYLTYMLVHVGWMHLIVNLLVQMLLGPPLEMVHKWWRVIIIYSAGVVAGSFGTSITDPRVFLAGASGGVYALMAAHVSTIVLNWSQMEYAVIQLMVFIVLAVVDTGTAIYNRYVLEIEGNIGYVAHLTGALAGLLVGFGVLKNLEVRSWEQKLWWFAIVVYFGLMVVAILLNVFWTDHFPASRHGMM